jgi:hypothetical protein
MSSLIPFPDGGFAFLEGVFPYSQGVAALPGFAIERVRFARPLPVAQGFEFISNYLKRIQRPLTAFCACELRSPKPFTFAGFGDFNKSYVAVLEQWGLYRDGRNAVGRSNVAPEIDPPAEPCFYAFSYTVPSMESGSFVVAGSGEWPEGGRFPEDIVARGDTSEAGMRAKTGFVLGKMEQRMHGLGGFGWQDSTVVQIYTAYRFPIDEVTRRIGSTVTWQYCRPPIAELDFEMDVRGVSIERVIGAA